MFHPAFELFCIGFSDYVCSIPFFAIPVPVPLPLAWSVASGHLTYTPSSQSRSFNIPLLSVPHQPVVRFVLGNVGNVA